MWNSTAPLQKNSELVQLSAVTFQLNSPSPPPRPVPSSVPQAAAALTEGLCQFPSDCHSHFCLYYQQCTGAVLAWKGCWSLSLHSRLALPWTWLRESETGRAGGKGYALGKGWGREEAGGWEGKEWEKKRERNQPKKVREDRGGPEGGGGSEEEQTEMEWGALIQFGSFSYFSYPFSSVQSFVSAFRNALFDWQPVTDQLPPKAAWQREVTAQEGI